jgi:hypothetical protein
LPFELIRDWDRNIEGRDLISKAQLYVVVNRSGRLSIYKTSEMNYPPAKAGGFPPKQ